MVRRPVVIALTGLLVLVVAVALVLTTVAGGEPTAADRSPPDAGPEPGEPGALRPQAVAWVYASPLFGPGGDGRYTLQAGFLGEPEPIIDLEVPLGVAAMAQPGRYPAVGAPVGGAVTYVVDDGTGSVVRRAVIARDGPDQQVGALDEIVWSLAVAPDGGTAYLALADRADPERDLGIVRLALDGTGRTERVTGPAADAGPSPFRLAARAAFDRDLEISPDGGHLVRRACAPDIGCSESVIDVATGAVTEMDGRQVLGVAGGLILAQNCARDCGIELIDLASGAIEPVPGIQFEARLVPSGDGPRVAFLDPQARVLHALDPRDGTVVQLLEADQMLSFNALPADLRLELPAGYCVVAALPGDPGEVVDARLVAVPVAGGAAIELPPPPLRTEFGEAQG